MKVKNILFMSLLASTMMLGACSGQSGKSSQGTDTDLSGTYDITMWGSETEGVPELFAQQVKDFEAVNEGIKINLTYEEVSEASASSKVLTSVDEAADIYCFAQDQFADLVLGQALSPLGKAAGEAVSNANDAGSVAGAKSGDTLYAYPMTADNGYFMYYDKSVISEDIVGDLEAIVAACEAAGKNFSMETNTSAWYIASFFFGAGCTSQWTTNADGDFIAVQDDFNSAKGLVAMRGMQHLVKSANYVSSSSCDEQFNAAIPAAVVVSGTWDYNKAKAALGDNLGVAELPSFKVDGTSYHLGSFSGFKLMGVKPQTNQKKLAVCHKLATYLTGEKCQLERFNTAAWGPSNKVAAASEAVKANPALSALIAQAPYAKPQGQIPGAWWDFAKVLGSVAAEAALDDTVALQAGLTSYYNSLDAVLHPTELPVWALVGTIGEGAWNAATATYLTEDAGGKTWSAEVAVQVDAEFKACPVMKEAGTVTWDSEIGWGDNCIDNTSNFGVGDGTNIKCLTAGTYKFVVDVTAKTLTISNVA